MRAQCASTVDRLTPNDTRCLSDQASGVCGVVDARGPTYGGWHRPVGVDPAWRALVDRVGRADEPLPDALRLGFGDANDAALAAGTRPVSQLSHATLSLAVVAWAGANVSAAGVGSCRIYLRRAHAWSVVVEAQTLARNRPDLELPIELRDQPAQVLGLVPVVEPEVWSDVARPGDIFVACTSTVWADRHDWLVSFAGTPEQLLDECPELLSHLDSSASVCVVFASKDWWEQREWD